MFRFLHASDIHLDSPLVGLDRYESAPVDAMRGATRRAFDNLIQLAIAEGVAFLLLAGDLYDGDWKDYRTGLYFVDQMAKLRDAGIPVFITSGNHDAASQLTKNLRSPENVHFFSTTKPETHRLDECDVAIHGQGYATSAITENLAAAYPLGDSRLFNIGLLHTSLDGREGHAPYAPTSTQTLAQKHYDYWALGHVHRREIVSRDPWIVFPGNIQGRHARETGPKGCTLVTVDNGRVASVDERSVDVLRWAICRVDVEGAATTGEVLDRVSRVLMAEGNQTDSRALAARVEIAGRTECHDELAAHRDRWVAEVRAIASGVSSSDVWIEKVGFSTARPTHSLAGDDALASLMTEIKAATADAAEAEAVRGALADIQRALPHELLDGVDAIDLDSPLALTQLIQEASDLLLARIVREGSGR